MVREGSELRAVDRSRRLSPWTLSFRLAVGLAWLVLVSAPSFVRGSGKPPRPAGEPAKWKLVLWFAVLFLGFAALPLLQMLLSN